MNHFLSLEAGFADEVVVRMQILLKHVFANKVFQFCTDLIYPRLIKLFENMLLIVIDVIALYH